MVTEQAMKRNPIQAQFRNREQAESAVRKLKALRGEGFLLECRDLRIDADTLSSVQAEFAVMPGAAVDALARPEAADELFDDSARQCYALFAQIPDQVALQAQRVIEEVEGIIIS